MLTPQFNLPIHRELVIDLFAGGGGANTLRSRTEKATKSRPPLARAIVAANYSEIAVVRIAA